MANVRLENVYKIYPNGVLAVKDFNLNIENEEFIVFVGPSGCGKSTTLRMIAGLEDISAGRVYIDNCLVNDLEPKDRDISMVFQNYALYPNMTVYDNMAYGLRCQKFDLDVEDVSEEKKKNKFAKVLLFIPHLIKNRFNRSKLKEIVIREKVMNAAEILGITDYLNRKPKELSGGQRQRVALGRAIVRNPKVFLLDEPLSNLDAKLRVQMRSEITKLHQKLGTTFIYVTHDQTEAMTMGTRIVVMKDGIVQQVDTPLNLYEHPDNTFVATFLGSPQMNLFSGVVMNKNGKTYFMSEDLEIEINEGTLLETGPLKDYHEIYLGVRPDDIKISDKGYTTKIELIEQLGNQTILYFLLPGKNDFSTITIQDPARFFRVGEEITVSFNLDKLHLFDKESGESLKKANVTNVIKAKLTHNGSDLLINDLRLPNEFKKHFLDTKVTDINIHISSDKIQTKEDTKSLELKLEVMVNKIVKYSSYSVVFAKLEDGTKVVFKTTDEIKEGKMNIYIPIYDAEYYSSDDRKICSRLLVNDSKVAYAEYRKTKSIGVLMPKDIETGLHIKLGVSNKLYRVLDREELNGSLILKLESTKAKKYEGDLVKEIVTISTDLVDLFEGQFVYIK